MSLPLLLLGLAAAPAHAVTLNVGVGQPYSTLGEAVAVASDGDEIRIHPGDYSEAVVVDDLDLVLRSAQGVDTVTLGASGMGAPILELTGGASVEVEAITFDGGGLVPTVRVGDGSRLSAVDTVHRGGLGADGGCIDASDGGAVELLRGMVSGCVATGRGGGVAAARSGELTLTDVLVYGNVAADDGGGVRCSPTSQCAIVGSVLAANRSDGDGGGASLEADVGSRVERSLLAGNRAGRGGGVSLLGGGEVLQSVFCENEATVEGGGLWLPADTEVHGVHLVGNLAALGGAAVRATSGADVVDVLFLANAGQGPVLDGDGAVGLAYSWFHANSTDDDDVGGGASTTHGGDPMLVDYRVGDCLGSDFALGVGSPLRDAGNPSAAFDDPDGTRADIGAWSPAWPDVLEAGDLDGDGVPDSMDCAPYDATVHPGAEEVPQDGIDQDCDGSDACWLDQDGDGAGGVASVAATTADCSGPGEAATSGDCDDTRADVGPGAVEVCDADDVDEDCNGLADDADPAPTATTAFFVDVDGDGYGDRSAASVSACDPPPGATSQVGDCDDGDPDVHPDADELCEPPGRDEDCDGRIDDADDDVADGEVHPADDDRDGFPGTGTARWCVAPELEAAPDCDDSDPSITAGPSWYVDGDGDGHGAGPAVAACDAPAGHVAAGDDCDDDDPDIHPGADEVPDDGIDQDCSGSDATLTWSSGAGCGCHGGGAGGTLAVAWGLVALLRRRRP